MLARQIIRRCLSRLPALWMLASALAFATIWALVFLLMELFVTGTFQKEHAINYLLTYLVVTSVYELVGKYVFPKK